MKVISECVALLGDVVRSRESDRAQVHEATLAALERVNQACPAPDPLRVTVGDEMQGVYDTLGQAVAACYQLRDELFGVAEVRCGFGGGEVRIIDEARGIQDGPAWWQAREAIEQAEALARRPGQRGTRTGLADARPVANPLAGPALHLVDAQLAALSAGARRTFIHLRAGCDNVEAARLEDISPSANSQRITANNLRPLAAMLNALAALP